MKDTDVKIETTIPPPDWAPYGKKTKIQVPFDLMEVGNSYLLRFDPETETIVLAQQVAVRAHAIFRHTGKRFIYRTVENGIRVWRVE